MEHSADGVHVVPPATITSDEQRREIELVLAQVAQAKPQAEWHRTHPTLDIYDVSIDLPDNSSPYKSFISGSLDGTRGADDVELTVGMFEVHKDLQQKGIGTRLLQALATEGIKYDAKRLFGHVTSLSALKTRARVFGAENLRFFSYNPQTREKTPLAITYEQALAESEAKGKVDYGVEVDLTHLDTTGWEQAEDVTK
jgi:GNAT superfamily N-acetyltransferase